jgi:hypothetical protein
LCIAGLWQPSVRSGENTEDVALRKRARRRLRRPAAAVEATVEADARRQSKAVDPDPADPSSDHAYSGNASRATPLLGDA